MVSGASACSSSLNVVGNIIGSGTALSNLNYNSILNSPAIVNLNNPTPFISTGKIATDLTNDDNEWEIKSSINMWGYDVENLFQPSASKFFNFIPPHIVYKGRG